MHKKIPSTRFSSGVIVAHLIPTLYFLIAFAQSTVTEKDHSFIRALYTKSQQLNMGFTSFFQLGREGQENGSAGNLFIT